ncbi:MAG: threonine ammonia-lyase [Methanomicrobiales archaeon]|nr:threonine ammonia-lyase [Methanomicrobiales archaeon]
MVSLPDIEAARTLIRPHVIRTPLVHSPTLSGMAGAEVFLKLEAMQKGGSFKIRGALTHILSRRGEMGTGGVVAASAGNHAQGVALAARLAGVPATVVMPEWASISKQAATRAYGAEVILHGTSLEESLDRARELAGEGRTMVHAYNDPLVIAGQGTIGLEILEDLPTVDQVIVPVGGGGLIAGIAIAIRGRNPGVRVTGVQAAACPSAVEALGAGKPVTVESRRTLADGIRVRRVGDIPFPVIRDLVDRVVLVGEDAIADAMLLLLERKKVLAEGAGAAPLAALLSGSAGIAPGSRVVLVVSGGNLDIPLLERVIRRGLVRTGRVLHLTATLEDAPGILASMLTVIGSQGGNILHIHHGRGDPGISVTAVRLDLVIETRGPDHSRRIMDELEREGYTVTESGRSGKPGEDMV